MSTPRLPSNPPIESLVANLAATEALGARLAGLMRAGDIILLEGPLGAGKSALARAVLRALTGDPALDVPSPTYTLVQGYETPLGLVQHFDLWRLDAPGALLELGWGEGDAAIVEWPDRLGPLWPEGALVVTLEPAGGDARRVRLRGWEGRV